MGILQENVKVQVKELFKDLKNEVKLVVFTQESLVTLPAFECETCRDNRLLMEELASLSNKIKIEVYDFLKDKEKVKAYQIDKIPATAIVGEKDYGIRFYGLPAGYEFSTLIHAIKLVSEGESGISEINKAKLNTFTKPIHIQVFVTLTCPYCPQAGYLAYQLAIASDLIKADVINAGEFPQLAQKYNVFAVPKIVINEVIQFEGALPEDSFVEKVIMAHNTSI
uniref:Glutaredoxin n=1 Tax=candidate division WOR-3 bacterium TaxID=2052148 RepID=A0A7V3ZUQ6_UNCW3